MQAPSYTGQWFFVRSSEDKNKFYRLTTDPRGALRCECPAGRFHRKPCRHAKAVVNGEALAAQPKRRPSFSDEDVNRLLYGESRVAAAA